MSEGPRVSRITRSDVCRRSGVSSATVSRVLNGTAKVNEETRERVLRVVEELQYVPSSAARSLAGRRQNVLGVVFPEIGTGFWADILTGIDAAAAERGYHLLTAFSHGCGDEQDLVLRVLREGRIDAMIVMNLRLDAELHKEARRFKTPIILIDRPIAGLSIPAVTVDNIEGARAALSHLYGHGYRDVVLLAGDAATYDSRQRCIGCQRAAADAGVPWEPSRLIAGAFTEASGREAVETLLSQRNRPPRAIFCFNDNLALGAMEVLRERGWRIPEDVAVIGFDDITTARHLGLTTVHVPLNDMGRRAASMAIDALERKELPDSHMLPTRLVVRKSCGCACSSG